MLATLNDVLLPASREHYAVGLFNVVTLEQAEGVFQVAEALRAPLIIGTAERFLKSVSFDALAGMLRARARHCGIPVVLHFDHGATFEGCMRALRAGFTSVMYDCSAMPYEENVRNLAQVVRIAHAMGATVEGELGCVAGNEDGSAENESRAMMTDPAYAQDYVERTGIDALAVSVGNAHGAYKLPPKLDFELIRTIRDRVPVPLVLHGGSGLTDDDFARAIQCGIAKVNIFTDINAAQADAARRALDGGAADALHMLPAQIEAVRRVAEEKIRLFGSAGKADDRTPRRFLTGTGEKMMEEILSASLLMPFPEEDKARVDALLREAAAGENAHIVVLDDDPTGVQTVHGVSVYTDWSVDSLVSGLNEENRLFFVLTNSRGFTAAQTECAHREIIENLVEASRRTGKPFTVVSRSDSTLRGHYPLETQVLADGLKELTHAAVDGEILCPFFREGGRFTLGDVHYVRYGDRLVPAAQTEFAADKTFGYAHSNLREYIEEKTKGAVRAEDVVSVSLEELRALDIAGITKKLMALHDFGKVVVNATDDDDVKVFCIALYRAMAAGKRFCFRTAAAFVKAFGCIPDRPLLSRAEMVAGDTAAGGIIVVGSHTKKTTAQLEALVGTGCVVPIEMDSDLVLVEGALEQEAARITAQCDALIEAGKTPVVYTRRRLLTVENDTPEAALVRSVRISDALQSVVGNLKARPAFVIAKGGITSSDVGTKALGVKRAKVLGQIRPGIPVWQTGEESRFPGVAYVIFPGNVGETGTLAEAAEILLGKPDAVFRQK